ncbi:deoxyribodipyrimidine photo-lyase [Eikenella sp. S3360]|uniref:Deoxyribodipyrimidine photo-lyase n=1 Tax=Eikenella glucosivorans TaxID=2766967 RepID=A0ABS0NCK2_9NEIS|nr:deoxyribodipyrimidine photo-lyase [Eikenella glucosivorans]MBH5330031.1 deoxyribodipyrimidine photo-lyase [Eikenella glucosivorans]
MTATTLVWFHRDLRTDDQPALQLAARTGRPLVGAYVWPPQEELTAQRRYFIWQCLQDLAARLTEVGIPLYALEGVAEQALASLAARCRAAALVCTADADLPPSLPAALAEQGCALHTVADGLLQQPHQFALPPYLDNAAFAPFQAAWQAACAEQYAHWQAPVWPPSGLAEQQNRLPENLRHAPPLPAVPAARLTIRGGETVARRQWAEFLPKLAQYAVLRDLPAQHGSSQLSPHWRFGTLSLRRAWAEAARLPEAAAWLKEWARREFFVHHFRQYPATGQGLPENERSKFRQNERSEFLRSKNEHSEFRQNGQTVWENNEQWIAAWQRGETGYPLVDAAMRLLGDTGWLPHSLRRLCALFFCRVLLCDWRIGADWFARLLLDFEPAANNGNWLLAAGLGVRPAEERPFNPVVWSQRLDPGGQFIRRHLPQLAHLDSRAIHAPWRSAAEVNTHGYPAPIADFQASQARWREMRAT